MDKIKQQHLEAIESSHYMDLTKSESFNAENNKAAEKCAEITYAEMEKLLEWLLANKATPSKHSDREWYIQYSHYTPKEVVEIYLTQLKLEQK